MPNISRSKGNQTMKFGQLIEYNMRKLKKRKKTSYTKCGGETSPRSLFWKIKIEHIFGLIIWNFIVCFYCILSWGLSKDIEVAGHLLLSHIQHIYKIKRGLELVSLPYFLHKFWRKIWLYNLSCYSLLIDHFLWLILLLEILGNMSTVIVC